MRLVIAATLLAAALIALIASSAYAQELDAAIDLEPSEVLVTVQKAVVVLVDNVPVATRDGGIVMDVPVREGDTVGSGDVLVELDRQRFEAERDAAVQERLVAAKESENDVDVRYAQKSSAVSKKVLVRSQRAAEQYRKAVSKTEIERLQLEFERAKLSGEQALHSREVKELTYELRAAQERVAQLRLLDRQITSPLSGVVAQVFVQAGQYVGAGQPIARVISLDRLKVEAYIDSRQVSALKVGQQAAIELAGDGEATSTSGEVVFISPEIDPVNGDVRVMIEIDNADRKFQPGMLVRLEIVK